MSAPSRKVALVLLALALLPRSALAQTYPSNAPPALVPEAPLGEPRVVPSWSPDDAADTGSWWTRFQVDLLDPRYCIAGGEAPLSAGVAGTLGLGYAFPSGNAFLVSYRYLGSDAENNWYGTDQSTRLTEHRVDLEYRFQPGYASEDWALQLLAGVRLDYLKLHNEAVFGDTTGGLQTVSVDFDHLAAGPRGGFYLERSWRSTGLGLFGQVDGSLLFGRRQIKVRLPDQRASDDAGLFMPGLAAELGAHWTYSRLRLALGYRVEQFWMVEFGASDDRPDIEFLTHGLFLRAELRF